MLNQIDMPPPASSRPPGRADDRADRRAGPIAAARGLLAAAIGVATLPSCMVGPDYARPPAFLPQAYTEDANERVTDGASGTRQGKVQTLAPGAAIAGDWWRFYRSPALSALVETALVANPSVVAAEAALRNAQELTLAQYAGLLGSVSGNFAYSTGQFPLAAQGEPNVDTHFGFHDAQLNFAYNLDVWGLTRRGIEQRAAIARSVRFLLEATDLTLIGNVVATAITAASLSAQVDAQKRLIGVYRNYLATVQAQFDLGGATGTDVALQQSQLGQAEAVLPLLETGLAQARDALADDIGRVPAGAGVPQIDLDRLVLPPVLPLSLPIALLAQRPDILQASANLHAAVAGLDVAIAQRFPQFGLSGQLGSEAVQGAQLFTPGNALASFVAGVMAPIFTGGLLLHQQRAAAAFVRQQAALWQQTVLAANQQVADVLNQIQGDSRLLAAQVAAEHASARALELAQLQFRLGGASNIVVLTAEIAEQNTLLGLIRARAARLSDSAALVVALGGGWWNRDDVPPPPPGVLRSLLPWTAS